MPAEISKGFGQCPDREQLSSTAVATPPLDQLSSTASELTITQGSEFVRRRTNPRFENGAVVSEFTPFRARLIRFYEFYNRGQLAEVCLLSRFFSQFLKNI